MRDPGRKLTEKTSITLSEPLKVRLVTLAQQRGIDQSEVVRTALGDYFDRQDKLIPRQSKPRAAPSGQARIPLEPQV